MKKLFIAAALLATSITAYAACTSQTFIINGKMTVCQTCCYGTSCNTVCY